MSAFEDLLDIVSAPSPFRIATSTTWAGLRKTEQAQLGAAPLFLIGVGRAALTQLPLPPNRTGGFPASGSPVSGFTSSRIDARRRRLSQEKTAPAPQSRHLASVHGPASTWPDLVSGFASAEDCVSGLVPTRRWVERSSSGCV